MKQKQIFMAKTPKNTENSVKTSQKATGVPEKYASAVISKSVRDAEKKEIKTTIKDHSRIGVLDMPKKNETSYAWNFFFREFDMEDFLHERKYHPHRVFVGIIMAVILFGFGLMLSDTVENEHLRATLQIAEKNPQFSEISLIGVEKKAEERFLVNLQNQRIIRAKNAVIQWEVTSENEEILERGSVDAPIIDAKGKSSVEIDIKAKGKIRFVGFQPYVDDRTPIDNVYFYYND